METVAATIPLVIGKPKGNIRWKVITLLLIVGIINYLDRMNLSIAAPQMMKELGLTNTWALAGDVAPPSMIASVGSIQNFGGYFGGAFSPIVAGMIVDATGSYTLAFVSAGIIVACAAICYWFIVKQPIEVPA